MRDTTFDLLRDLVRQPSPPGREEAVDDLLRERLAGGRGEVVQDAAGNVALRLRGRGERRRVAIVAHKDEIAAAVKRVEADGRIRLRPVGDAHPWIWGETPLVLLGDHEAVDGVLSFGARHVSPASPQHGQLDDQQVRWRDAWVVTKRSADELAAAGVRAGTRAVLPPGRRDPVRLGVDAAFVASPVLDDKIAVAGLLLLAERLRDPAGDVDLVFSSREEIGCQGLRFYARQNELNDLVALEVAPVAEEYGLTCSEAPVVVVGDPAALLSDSLGRELGDAAASVGVPLQHAFLDRYASDASTALSDGLVARGGCLAVAVENTHGCEIAHLDAVERCVSVLQAWLERPA
jgi:putative aminopeptidase FrvX